MTVVGNSASPTQSVLVHNCAKEWLATTIYREMPAATTSSPPLSLETSTASPGGSAISTSSTPPPNPAPTAIEAKNDSSKLEPEESSKPKAGLIAGITVAGVFVVLLVGLLGFWFGRRNGLRSRGGASHSEDGTSSGNPVQLLGPSSSSTSHARTATDVSGIGSIPGVPTDPWYGFTFPAPPKSPRGRGYPESPYDKFIGVQVNEMEGDSVSVHTMRPGTGGGEKKFAGSSFFDHELGGIELAAGPTPPASVYRDSSRGRKSVRMGHAELEGEGLGALVRKKSMI